MKNKLIIVLCFVFLSLSLVSAIDNFNINSSTGELFFVNGTSGNVGIGTTAPGTKLEVNGEISSTSSNAFRMVYGNYGTILRNDGSNTYMLLTASGSQYGTWNSLRPFILNDASGQIGLGNNTLVVQHNGNVGIGTTGPDTALHISGDFDGSDNYAGTNSNKGLTITKNAGGYAVSEQFGIVFADYYDYPIAGVLAKGTEVGSYLGGTLHFQTKTKDDSNLLDRMTIDKDGNVGIGTTSPGQKLHVYNGGLLVNNSDNASLFFVDNVTGNVGIGTINPTEKLEVNGSIRVKPFIPSSIPTLAGESAGIFGGASDGFIGMYANTDATNGGCIEVSGNDSIGNPGGVEVILGTHGLFQVHRWNGNTYENLFTLSQNDSTANVGIGDSTPDFNLEVIGNLSVSSSANADGDLFMVTTAGNVGIGTTEPTGKLHIVESGALKGQITTGLMDLPAPFGVNFSVGLGVTITDFGPNEDPTAAVVGYSLINNVTRGALAVGWGTEQVGIGVLGVSKNISSSRGFSGFLESAIEVTTDGSEAYLAYMDDSNDTWSGYFQGNVYVRDNVGIGTTAPDHDLEIGTGTYSEIDAGEAQFTTSSSRTFKENIEPVYVNNILDKIAEIPVNTYDFKPELCNDTDEKCKNKIGLIAEDFHVIFERGSDKQLSGQEIQMALWLGIQELKAERDNLKSQNQQILNRLETLENK